VAQTPVAARCSACDLQRFDRCFLSQLQFFQNRIENAPPSSAISAVERLHIIKHRLQCFGHTLCCSVRDTKFLANFIETDSGSPDSSQPRKSNEVLGLGERQN
jgi:hypothetical protein